MNVLELIIQRLKSKTYLTALTLALLSVIEVNLQLVSQFIPLEYRSYLIMIWPVVMLTLREVTTAALSEK